MTRVMTKDIDLVRPGMDTLSSISLETWFERVVPMSQVQQKNAKRPANFRANNTWHSSIHNQLVVASEAAHLT